jgi:eukaryotic-like serine/threonine-protein kinase
VPEEYDELVLWATMRDPDDRPHDAGELLARLVEIRAGGSMGAARTTVMPSLPDGATRILPADGLLADELLADDEADTATSDTAGAAGAAEQPSVARLRRSARRRRILGGWAFALVVLVGAAAAGTGWYFGTGPGALVSVPAVTGDSVTAARASLVDADLRARVTTCASRTVAKGHIVRTSPRAGTRLHQDDIVRVCASSGPSQIAVPDLDGASRAKATALLTAAGFVVDAAAEQDVFRDDLHKGKVVRALDANGTQLGATYLDGRTVSLVVSLGSVPEVRGDSVDGATSELTDAGLAVSGPPYAKRHSGSIPSGDVLEVVITGDNTEIPRGTSVSIVVSSGPKLVAVPNVVGANFQDGVQALKDAGFKVSAYTILAEDFWATPGFLVASTDPAGDTMAPKGSTITVTPNAYAGDPSTATETPAPTG